MSDLPPADASDHAVDQLVDAARLRRSVTIVQGESLQVREPSALEWMEYRSFTAKGDVAAAVTFLLERCVTRLDGSKRFDKDSAMVVANGRAEVFLPIVMEVTGFDAAIDGEKKSSPIAKSSFIGWLLGWVVRSKNSSAD